MGISGIVIHALLPAMPFTCSPACPFFPACLYIIIICLIPFLCVPVCSSYVNTSPFAGGGVIPNPQFQLNLRKSLPAPILFLSSLKCSENDWLAFNGGSGCLWRIPIIEEKCVRGGINVMVCKWGPV